MKFLSKNFKIVLLFWTKLFPLWRIINIGSADNPGFIQLKFLRANFSDDKFSEMKACPYISNADRRSGTLN